MILIIKEKKTNIDNDYVVLYMYNHIILPFMNTKNSVNVFQ